MSKINRPAIPVGIAAILAGCDEEDLNFLSEEDQLGIRQFMADHGIKLKRDDTVHELDDEF